MKITRFSGIAALAAATALVLSACGSDAEDTTSSAGGAATSAAASATGAAGSAVESATEDGSSAAGSETGGDTSADASADSSAAGSADSSADGSAGSSADGSAGSSADGSAGSSADGSAGGSAAAGASFEDAGFACATGELRSSGSTAQGKAIAAWIQSYNDKCGAKINDYGGGGSGTGITDFTANQTDFAGSDSALKEDQVGPAAERCAGNPALNLPMVTGPIAIAYNVEGIDDLTLTPKVLAGIFDDQIISWDDPAIAEINPDVTLPATAIQSIHRSEDSGTTENFVKYLLANDSGWAYEGGKAWEAQGGTGAQGSDGVAAAVAGSDGSVGYVEWGFATDNDLNIAKIDNGAGAVELTAESVGKTVSTAKVVGEGSDLALELDYATQEDGAYPLILVTYEIVCSAGNGDKAELIKSFLGYAATDGQQELLTVGAAPLPAELQTQVIEAVNSLS